MFHQMLGQLQQATYDQQQRSDADQLDLGNTVDTLITGGMTAINGPKCKHCGKMYSNASNLRQHIRNVHALVDRSLWHECLTCGKKLKTKHYLINHQLQAHGIHQRA